MSTSDAGAGDRGIYKSSDLIRPRRPTFRYQQRAHGQSSVILLRGRGSASLSATHAHTHVYPLATERARTEIAAITGVASESRITRQWGLDSSMAHPCPLRPSRTQSLVSTPCFVAWRARPSSAGGHVAARFEPWQVQVLQKMAAMVYVGGSLVRGGSLRLLAG